MVAAHPVHAELRAASPKTATNNPISLDAILVCCKRTQRKSRPVDPDIIIERTLLLAEKLTAGGMQLSAADRFVIAASQTLIAASAERLSFEQAKTRLEGVRHRLCDGTGQKDLPV